MPNRIIKESLCISERIAALSDFEFRLWVGLITQADDAGRGDARAAILKGRVFPLRERVTVKDIDLALHALAAHGCVALYTVDGRLYYVFPRWAQHQRVRDVKAKYPPPPEDIAADMTPCGAPPRSAAEGGLNPNPNPKSNPDPKGRERFAPPTPEEVRDYCRERNNRVDPERFVDYYASNGWRVGKNPMKDWRAAVRSWERQGREGTPAGGGSPSLAKYVAELQKGREKPRPGREARDDGRQGSP